jgi:hypothetical protein
MNFSPDLKESKRSRSEFIPNLFFSLILSINIINFTVSGTHMSVLHSGITATVEEAANTIKGFGRLLDSLKSIIDIISTAVSPEVLLLFIAAAVIGFGLSFLGIPKGRISFLFSLGIADLFWFIWVKSFYTETSEFVEKIFLILKTNFIIIVPFIIIAVFKSPAISKKVLPKIFSFIKFIVRRKHAGLFDKKELAEITDELNLSFMMFQKSVINDVLIKKEKDSIELSSETINLKNDLQSVLKKFEKK